MCLLRGDVLFCGVSVDVSCSSAGSLKSLAKPKDATDVYFFWELSVLSKVSHRLVRHWSSSQSVQLLKVKTLFSLEGSQKATQYFYFRSN